MTSSWRGGRREHEAPDTAPIFAAMEADKMLEAGDLDGAATWRRIVKAIHDLTGTEGTRH